MFQQCVSLFSLGLILALPVNAASHKKKADSDQTANTQATPAGSKSRKTAPAQPLDLNTASEKELDTLPGVGPATASKITSHRPYTSVDDLKKAGVPASTVEKIRNMVTVSSSPATAKAEARPSSAATRGEASRQKPSPVQSTGVAEQPPPAGSGMVWVNLKTKVYHREGDRWYGKTKDGKYMSEADAEKAGYRASKEQ